MEQTKSKEAHPFILPGEYSGIWGGYILRIKLKHGNMSEGIKMNNGIRCIGKDVNVHVDESGWVTIK